MLFGIISIAIGLFLPVYSLIKGAIKNTLKPFSPFFFFILLIWMIFFVAVGIVAIYNPEIISETLDKHYPGTYLGG